MEAWLISAILAAVGALIAAAAAQAWSGARWRRRRLAIDVERYSALADLLARRDDALVRSLSQGRRWDGYRKFRITGKVLEADNIASFYLRPLDGGALPGFRAGQFLTLRLRDAAEGGGPLVRCYTLSRSYAQDRDYRITVKRLTPPDDAEPGSPPGKASSWFHHSLEEDSVVEAAAPEGQFTLEAAAGRPVVFIAGGIGITPFLAMAEHLAQHEPEREAWLFHGVPDRRQQFGADYLRQWAENPNFRYVTCFSRQPESDPSPGAGAERERGWVTIDVLRRRLPSSNYEFYVCGPPAMMAALPQALREWGVPPGSIHTEAFSAGTVRELGMASLSGEQSWEVSFRGHGAKLRWQPDSGTILELAERNGLSLPSGCRAGNCGTCAVPVLSGSFTCLSRPGAPVDEGSCLVCISVPAESMELA